MPRFLQKRHIEHKPFIHNEVKTVIFSDRLTVHHRTEEKETLKENLAENVSCN